MRPLEPVHCALGTRQGVFDPGWNITMEYKVKQRKQRYLNKNVLHSGFFSRIRSREIYSTLFFFFKLFLFHSKIQYELYYNHVVCISRNFYNICFLFGFPDILQIHSILEARGINLQCHSNLCAKWTSTIRAPCKNTDQLKNNSYFELDHHY